MSINYKQNIHIKSHVTSNFKYKIHYDLDKASGMMLSFPFM